MTYKQFRDKWIGKRVDADGVYQYQCVDLVRQYIHELYGAPRTGAWGNAIDYWTHTNSNVLKYFTKVSDSNAKQGDIVVLYGNPGNPYGHIGIATGGLTANAVEILEQNGSTGNGSGTGGDAIRERFVDRKRVAGLLRPKSAPAQGGSKVTKAEAQGIVKALYKGLFGRAADKGGLDNYTNHILNGNYDFTVKDMVGSQEFKNRHVKTVTKTVTKTVEKPVRDPKDVKKIEELGKALEICQKNGGGNADVSYIRRKVDEILAFVSSFKNIFK